MDLDLTAAVEAGLEAWREAAPSTACTCDDVCAPAVAAAVRAAAPIIERAALEQAVERCEATFIAGARPEWAGVGVKPRASLIREWIKRTILDEESADG